MKTLIERLAEIQRTLNAPKSQFNSFGKYSYRNCEDILQAVKPLLNGDVICISDEIANIGDRFYVKATATFYHADLSHSVTAFARESLDKKGMDSAQVTGAASSYARKYALNGLLLIDDNKDADSVDNRQAAQPVSPAPAPRMEVTPDNLKWWDSALKSYKKNGNFDAIMKHANISSANQALIVRESNNV